MAESSSDDQVTRNKMHKCIVCKTKFPDADSYIEHLESKDHQKGIMKEKYGKKYLEAKAKLDEKFNNDEIAISEEKSKLVSDKSLSENENTDEDRGDEVYTCLVCRIVCTGFLNYQMHLNGQKHQKNLRKEKLLKQLHESNAIPKVTEEKPHKESSLWEEFVAETQSAFMDINCKTCNKTFSSPESFKQHCKSEKHLKKIKMQESIKEMKSGGISAKGISDDTVFAHCDVCQKDFSGPLPYQQHMESAAHMKEERNVQQLSKIKDLVVCSEDNSKLQCKECGKVFSGPVPFYVHLKSSAHAKLQFQKAHVESLEQEEHPRKVKVPLEVYSDNEDDVYSLRCTVCDLVCTGPKSAREHFKSDKHKKAMKLKSRHQKYAKLQDEKNPERFPMPK